MGGGSRKNFRGGGPLGVRSRGRDQDGSDLGSLQLPSQEESLCSGRVGGAREVETGKSGREEHPEEGCWWLWPRLPPGHQKM